MTIRFEIGICLVNLSLQAINNLLRKFLIVGIPYNMEKKVGLNKKSYPLKLSSFDI